MSPLIEQRLRVLLSEMADIVGPEYEVAFIAKNGKRHDADILLGDKDLNKLLRNRLPSELQIGTDPRKEIESDE